MWQRKRERLGVSQDRLAVNWDLVWALARRDLKVRYRQSMLGFFWSALHPLLMMMVLHVVFSSVFRFQIDNFPVYALAGIMYWNFFSQTIIHAMSTIKGNRFVIRQMPVKPITFPMAAVAAASFHLLLEIGPLLAVVLVTGHHLGWGLLMLPLAIALNAAFALGISLALGPLAVGFGDVEELVGVLLKMFQYLTPVFYPLAIVPERYLPFVLWNPLRFLLETFREPIYHGGLPVWSDWGIALVATIVALGVGYLIFRRAEPELVFKA